MVKNTLIASLLTLALAPAAQAAVPADQVVPADALAIARAQWPDSPCAGREQIEVMDQVVEGGAQFAAWAFYDSRCLVEVRADWLTNSWSACRLLSHEFGHLSGYRQHSADPHDIMYAGTPPTDFAPCAVLLQPKQQAAPIPALDAAPEPTHRLNVVKIKPARKHTRRNGHWSIKARKHG